MKGLPNESIRRAFSPTLLQLDFLAVMITIKIGMIDVYNYFSNYNSNSITHMGFWGFGVLGFWLEFCEVFLRVLVV